MMISPEGFIQEHIDKPYAELLCVRDEPIVLKGNYPIKCKNTAKWMTPIQGDLSIWLIR